MISNDLMPITNKVRNDINTVLITCVLFSIICMFYCSCNSNKVGDKYESYQEAVRAYDFAEAHKMLDKLHEEALSSDFDEEKDKYEVAASYIFNAEAKFLCAKGDKESMNRIIFLLSDFPSDGVPIPEGTKYTNDGDLFYRHEKHEEYIRFASRLNQNCNSLIDLAIANHNWELAEKTLPFYKMVPDPIKEKQDDEEAEKKWKKEVGGTKWIYKEHTMTYSNIDKLRAIEKLNKAIDDGVFPNVTKHIN